MAIDRVARDKNQEQDARLDKLEECAQIDAETISDLLKRVAALENAQTPTPQPTPTQKGISVGGDFQNWSSTDRAKYLDFMKAAGCNWVRVDYNYGAEGPGITVAREAQSRGMKVLAVLIARGRTLNPMEMADFAGAKAHDADAFEVWNEENLSSFWPSPSPEEYAKVYNAAKGAIKAIRPNVPVISGGLSPAPNSTSTIDPRDYLTRALNAGMQPDAIGWHPYCNPNLPGQDATWSTWTKMTQHPTWGKYPIWLTEFGAPTNEVSEAFQATSVTKAFDLWKSYGLSTPIFIYQGRDKGTNASDSQDHYGLLRYDWTPKPAYDAFKGA